MKHFKIMMGIGFFTILFAMSSCNFDDGITDAAANGSNQTSGDQSFTKVGQGGMIWADCELFRTIGTPAHFKAESGPFDELYNVAGAGTTFKDGIAAISESKPGDKDFNGGRWHVNVLKEGVSLDKYLNACSVEDLDLNDFMPSDTYFECPLIPSRGHTVSDE